MANPRVLVELRTLFERRYSLPELLEWLHSKVEWSKGNIRRHHDPIEMLEYGKGKCGEFGVLFTALCLAHDYRARLVLDMSDHVWTGGVERKREEMGSRGSITEENRRPEDVRKRLEEELEGSLCFRMWQHGRCNTEIQAVHVTNGWLGGYRERDSFH